jgi:hypothetical protein
MLLRVLILTKLFVGDKIEVLCQVQNLHKKSYNSVQLMFNRKAVFRGGGGEEKVQNNYRVDNGRQ